MSPTVIQTYDACFYCITNVPQVHLFQNFIINSQLDNILGLLIIIVRIRSTICIIPFLRFSLDWISFENIHFWVTSLFGILTLY